jgi:hypothetical protein
MTDRASQFSFVLRNAGRIVGMYFGGLVGVMLAWFTVDWPDPPATLPRIFGWVFFVSLGAFGGYAIAESR